MTGTGRAAVALGLFLLWYALWTVCCTTLVLRGAHYPAFLWATLLPSAATILAGWRFGGRVARAYAPVGRPAAARSAAARPAAAWVAVAITAASALVAADLGNRTPSGIPYITATIVGGFILYRAAARGAFADPRPGFPAIGWRFPALLLVLATIYFLGHRVDGDDANFVNMAIGAQRTAGGVFQYDTMLGDGPNPIHLPTYKFHSFELLGAVLSTLTGLTPLVVLHLLLPALLLPFLAAALMLMLIAGVGRAWLAAALLWLAFLFVNEVAVGGWGIHGVIRLYQGKGFLVSALLPLIAALTVRWMRRGERLDLVGLVLAGTCAVGFSANGLYGAPAASGLVAAAFVVSAPRSGTTWRRAVALLPTLAWPAIVVVLIVTLDLALPSEVTTATYAIDQLNFAAGYGPIGRLTLAVLALAGLGLMQAGLATAGLLYLPLAMLLTLNPVTWPLISGVTGNLGFRIFWSIPAAVLAAMTGIALMRMTGLRSERWITLAAGAALSGSILLMGTYTDPLTTVRWHRPDLKVVRPDYDLAGRLAARTPDRCDILAPETYSSLLAMIPDAPYPAFVRQLYLIHYRFTMAGQERALRERLRLVVDGPAGARPPAPREMAMAGIPIGTVAVRADAPSRPAAAGLARSLGLSGPVRDGPLLIWTGTCSR